MSKHIAPHTFFFLLLTILYGVPVLLTLFFEINADVPYISDNFLLYKDTRWAMLSIYIIAVISFLFGSKIIHDLMKHVDEHSITTIIKPTSFYLLSTFQRLLIYCFIVLGIVIVWQMFRAGTFSSGYMESFSVGFESQNMFTVLCEIFFFLFIYLWINYSGKYKGVKFLLVIMILLTILKGSRMFTVPLLFFLLYKYIYIDGLTKKVLLKICFGGLIALLLLCAVFFMRHDTSLEGINIGKTIFLLIQYESCGVHVPLMKVISLGWHTSFAPMFLLVTDVFFFLVPRTLFSRKNDYLFFDNTNSRYELSPLGGMNGEASVILYFGLLFPLFFIILGGYLSRLYKVSSIVGGKIQAFYIYICCSFLFVFLRNGILIALKEALIVWILLMALLFVRRLTINFSNR
jgi:hypothetical protein